MIYLKQYTTQIVLGKLFGISQPKANVRYFDEEGTQIREMAYTEIKPFGERFYPTEWIMEPKEPEKEGHRTLIQISDAVFDDQVNESYFTKRVLKRYSD